MLTYTQNIDLTDMVGGELQVVMQESKKAFDMLAKDQVKPEDLLTAHYKSAGYHLLFDLLYIIINTNVNSTMS